MAGGRKEAQPRQVISRLSSLSPQGSRCSAAPPKRTPLLRSIALAVSLSVAARPSQPECGATSTHGSDARTEQGISTFRAVVLLEGLAVGPRHGAHRALLGKGNASGSLRSPPLPSPSHPGQFRRFPRPSSHGSTTGVESHRSRSEATLAMVWS